MPNDNAWKLLSEGSVWVAPAGQSSCLSRCALLDSGRLLVSFTRQGGLGGNDGVTMLTHSDDGGTTWSVPRVPWPQGQRGHGVFGSISRDDAGRLFIYGMRIPIDTPGESFWQDINQGIKQNQLFWSSSEDDGASWSEPAIIPMKSPGSAESPGALCVTPDGVWLAPYAPYNTFDVELKVQRNRVLAMRSTDHGRTWAEIVMQQFDEIQSGGAEQWITPLGNRRLVSTSWHIDHTNTTEFPNRYSVSNDDGLTWSQTRSTGIDGNTTALAPHGDGRALFAYVMRKPNHRGIGLAVIEPSANDFGIRSNQMIYEPFKATQSGKDAQPNVWVDFAFGEPSLTVLKDGTLFVTFWTGGSDNPGVRYMHLSPNR